MDGVPTLHPPIHPSGTRCHTLHRAERIRCVDVMGYTVTDVLDRVRCFRVYRYRVMSIVPCRVRAEAAPLSVPFGAQVMDILSTLPKEFTLTWKDYPHLPSIGGGYRGKIFFAPHGLGGHFGGLVRGEGVDTLRR